MEGEINNFIQVWITVFVSLCFCYFVASKVPKGKLRLLTTLPICGLFLLLPLKLHTVHLGGTTAFFVAWLANFKLLLFSFGKGPLSSHPSISPFCFISVACLPIKIKQDPSPPQTPNPSADLNNKRDNPSPHNHIARKSPKSLLNYAIKALLLALLIRVYDYRPYFHQKVILTLYCFHVYFLLEVILAGAAYLARVLLNLELEGQFDEPYLSTSLQDFWGRRWNIMVTNILRPTVYEPTRGFFTQVIGRKWAALPATMATFVVSGLIHELIFFYLGRVEPTWEVTWFFILHGLCLVLEIAAKKALVGRWGWRLHGAVSRPLVASFVLATSSWLFFPQFLRCRADVRALDEYAAVAEFVRNVGQSLLRSPYSKFPVGD
ncbi:PREDICTED: acyl-CoA--sterol O-acyltransferase 1-like [Nelumbo nucifera]|uniref:Acyl-CoA--sterol O-acyltransferase 1-like n=2 Tax=Nelumbo nucifera TaxID=4432 RepID=A0A1U8B2B2_NELNU|nr:PREDICTED: acyl-CoA--sterol O-acyltransferase 1-like [Nelumbo nucifera]DAD20326.1 TPA_asm: hypothetical protein HUJ06_021789 [Nelumbo nucifera]